MELLIIGLILLIIFDIVYYIPSKLKEQEEKQSLHFKELYARINRLESKLDELNNSKEN